VALWAVGVQIPPPTRQLPANAPEAITASGALVSPVFPREMPSPCERGYGSRTGRPDARRCDLSAASRGSSAKACWHRYDEGGLTQSDVARSHGIAPSNVSRWESGTARPRADTAVELLKTAGGPVIPTSIAWSVWSSSQSITTSPATAPRDRPRRLEASRPMGLAGRRRSDRCSSR
jgi:DNA-binding XRE family transcriptional regulator